MRDCPAWMWLSSGPRSATISKKLWSYFVDDCEIGNAVQAARHVGVESGTIRRAAANGYKVKGHVITRRPYKGE